MASPATNAGVAGVCDKAFSAGTAASRWRRCVASGWPRPTPPRRKALAERYRSSPTTTSLRPLGEFRDASVYRRNVRGVLRWRADPLELSLTARGDLLRFQSSQDLICGMTSLPFASTGSVVRTNGAHERPGGVSRTEIDIVMRMALRWGSEGRRRLAGTVRQPSATGRSSSKPDTISPFTLTSRIHSPTWRRCESRRDPPVALRNVPTGTLSQSMPALLARGAPLTGRPAQPRRPDQPLHQRPSVAAPTSRPSSTITSREDGPHR